MADDDLEDFWAELRRSDQVIVPVHNEASNFKGQLLLASETSKFDMRMKFEKRLGEALTQELLLEIVSTAIDTTLKRWYESLRNQDTAGLIEIILEGQKDRMPPQEMTSFLQALPMSLLERVLANAAEETTGTGVHMLLALEKNRRNSGALYSLKSAGGSIIVTWQSPQGEVEFNLWEKYDLSPKSKT